MSESVGVFDAKARFSELIDRAEQGEEIIVTRHGKPVARVAPLKDAAPRRTPEQVAAMMEAWRRDREALRARMGTVTQAEIKAWKEEGQR